MTGVQYPSPYARQVDQSGFNASHRRLMAEVHDGARVLDVGCATGYLAAELSRRGCTVVGFEVDPASAALAEASCEAVVVGDIESEADRERIPGEFDVILLGDVLEHLKDPWEALPAMRSLLAPGGVVVASIPNVAASPVRLSLLRGSFEYTETGLLDRTHLRFFTRASVRDLVHSAGFVVERERVAPLEPPPRALWWLRPVIASLAARALARAWPSLFAQQFVLRLRPARPSGR